MVYKNLDAVLNKLFGPFAEEHTLILNALKKDEELNASLSKSDDVSKIINIFNEVFGKNSKVMSKKVLNKYKEILKYYSLTEVQLAMQNAKADEFHVENNFKYCTIEYFSRIEQMDKWMNIVKEQKQKADFILPKFNVRG
jgi:predicted transcriptional regulator